MTRTATTMAVAVAMMLAACGSDSSGGSGGGGSTTPDAGAPTLAVVVGATFGATCARIFACAPDAGPDVKHGATPTECANAGIAKTVESGGNYDAPSACTSAGVDACTADIGALACATILGDGESLPPSCAECLKAK